MPAPLEAWNERLRSLFGFSLEGHSARMRDGLRAACKDLGLDDDSELLLRIDGGDANARAALARTLTIGETYFFREPQHFALLRDTFLPAALARTAGSVVLVSAGCSSAEEAYSMATVGRQLLGSDAVARVRVLGFDINDRALATARRGVYRPWSLRGVSEEQKTRWFDRPSAAVDEWTVKPEIRALVTFEQRNLVAAVDALPRASADVIFCRNVLIYLDDPSVALVLTRLSAALRPGGSLVVGSAEAALFPTAGLGAHQMGDVWVHSPGDPLSAFGEDVRANASGAAPPAATPRTTPAPRRPAERRPRRLATPSPFSATGAAPATSASPAPPATAEHGADAARWLDDGWAMLAADPVSAGEQARRAILLDRTLAAAHVLAASAALAQSDTRGARRSIRHARRCLAASAATDVVRGAGGATAKEMAAYCTRIERALEERDG